MRFKTIPATNANYFIFLSHLYLWFFFTNNLEHVSATHSAFALDSPCSWFDFCCRRVLNFPLVLALHTSSFKFSHFLNLPSFIGLPHFLYCPLCFPASIRAEIATYNLDWFKGSGLNKVKHLFRARLLAYFPHDTAVGHDVAMIIRNRSG